MVLQNFTGFKGAGENKVQQLHGVLGSGSGGSDGDHPKRSNPFEPESAPTWSCKYDLNTKPSSRRALRIENDTSHGSIASFISGLEFGLHSANPILLRTGPAGSRDTSKPWKFTIT